jgi:hypothetical protein
MATVPINAKRNNGPVLRTLTTLIRFGLARTV